MNARSTTIYCGLTCLAVAAAMMFTGCASVPKRTVDNSARNTCRAIQAILEDQDDAWNRDDLDAFMNGYWNSPELTFVSGGTVTKGWQQTLDGYKKRYPDRAAMGTLAFSDLDVRELARDAALVSGRWHLERGEPIGGRFTLLFRVKAGRWVIVYDHTSVGEKKPES